VSPMKRVLRWTTMRINRRTALRGASAAAFGVLAAAAVGRPAFAITEPCTGPGGSGRCPSGNCSGSTCHNFGATFCAPVTGFCVTATSACWTSSAGGTCCDCKCHKDGTQGPVTDGGGTVPPRNFYCFCYG
jgi:hypothetical protein